MGRQLSRIEKLERRARKRQRSISEADQDRFREWLRSLSTPDFLHLCSGHGEEADRRVRVSELLQSGVQKHGTPPDDFRPSLSPARRYVCWIAERENELEEVCRAEDRRALRIRARELGYRGSI